MPVHVIQKNGLLSISTAHDVIRRTGIRDAQLAWHGATLPLPTANLACKSVESADSTSNAELPSLIHCLATKITLVSDARVGGIWRG